MSQVGLSLLGESCEWVNACFHNHVPSLYTSSTYPNSRRVQYQSKVPIQTWLLRNFTLSAFEERIFSIKGRGALLLLETFRFSDLKYQREYIWVIDPLYGQSGPHPQIKKIDPT